MDHLAENNRVWWEGQVTRLERDVIAAERAGDVFLARAHRGALLDAREKLDMQTRP